MFITGKVDVLKEVSYAKVSQSRLKNITLFRKSKNIATEPDKKAILYHNTEGEIYQSLTNSSLNSLIK